MITVGHAKKLIAQHVKRLPAVTVNIGDAAGHVLAEDCYAVCDIPAFRQSSMDGYALKFEDHLTEYTIVGEMAAGSSVNASVNSGEACRIFTGAPLPVGADTVIMQEKVTLAADQIIIGDKNLKKGLNIRERGSEITDGSLAMTKGTILTPAAIGFLAGIGLSEVNVTPQPKIAIILTGNELQKPGLPLAFGQVYESNSFALTAALKQVGISTIKVWEAKDELETLINILGVALEGNDIVLLTGGVSVGDYDFVVRAAEACGVEQIFHKVKQKPGKPLYFGKKQDKLIFGLPGNPSSVLSCFYNYVLQAIALLTDNANKVHQVRAALETDYNKPNGLTHFLKGIYTAGRAKPLGAQESFRLSSFAQANCLICLEEDKTTFKIGDMVTVLLLPG
ncbi:MAG: molybdopterin molybdenumtransferase MoeA [Pedobacter sp.]|nr:MAG: molybdopterin molybdenumtransferase MoeA [Pedobacter sp.]